MCCCLEGGRGSRVPSRVCSSCGTGLFCLIASKAEQTQAGSGVICCWEKKDPSENLISQRSKGVMHEAGAVFTISMLTILASALPLTACVSSRNHISLARHNAAFCSVHKALASSSSYGEMVECLEGIDRCGRLVQSMSSFLLLCIELLK